MKTNRSDKTLSSDERGLAAVVVTVFVMIILSLVVLAFSQVARREQRQALDRQLSTQAFLRSRIRNKQHGQQDSHRTHW